MTVAVVTTTTVEVEADVENVEVVDDPDCVDVIVVDEVTGVVVAAVDSVDTVEDVVATDDAEDDTSVVAVGVDSVVVDAGVVDVTVKVELSIGKTVAALAVAILEVTPTIAKKRITANAARTGTDFIQLSLVFTYGCQDWNGK